MKIFIVGVIVLALAAPVAWGDSNSSKADSAGKTRPKAYIISIGVGSYHKPKRDLQFPPADAMAYADILPKFITSSGRYTVDDVVPILLTNDGSWDSKASRWQNVTVNNAKREIILGVLDLLAGKPVSQDVRSQIPNSDRVKKAMPDDLVIIAYSGYGFLAAIDTETTYLVTSDPYTFNDLKSISRGFITESLIAESLSNINADTMAFIFDGGNFTDARTFATITRKKGVLLIAADDKAMEYDLLRHGMLTYALLEEGIKAGKAELKSKDISARLQELFDFASKRVPRIKREIETNTAIR